MQISLSLSLFTTTFSFTEVLLLSRIKCQQFLLCVSALQSGFAGSVSNQAAEKETNSSKEAEDGEKVRAQAV